MAPPRNGGSPELTTAAVGLTGAAGVLPRLYTEALTGTLRNGSHALHEFLDLLSQRMVAMFAGAAIKYRLARSTETAAWSGHPDDDRVAEALLAFGGFATPHLVPRLAVGAEPLLHYSGFFAARPRSAERLRSLLSDWLGRPVEIVQFAGTWLVLAAGPAHHDAAGPSSGRLEPARGRCRDRGARLGPAGTHCRAHRPARLPELHDAVAGQ